MLKLFVTFDPITHKGSLLRYILQNEFKISKIIKSCQDAIQWRRKTTNNKQRSFQIKFCLKTKLNIASNSPTKNILYIMHIDCDKWHRGGAIKSEFLKFQFPQNTEKHSEQNSGCTQTSSPQSATIYVSNKTAHTEQNNNKTRKKREKM